MVQVPLIFGPVSLRSIRPWAFSVRYFSYLPPYFFNLNMYFSSPSSLPTFLNQSAFSLCITTWSHISLGKLLLSYASGITISICVTSNLLNNLFWFDSNNRFCLYYSVLLSYISSSALTATSLCPELLCERLQYLSFLN